MIANQFLIRKFSNTFTLDLDWFLVQSERNKILHQIIFNILLVHWVKWVYNFYLHCKIKNEIFNLNFIVQIYFFNKNQKVVYKNVRCKFNRFSQKNQSVIIFTDCFLWYLYWRIPDPCSSPAFFILLYFWRDVQNSSGHCLQKLLFFCIFLPILQYIISYLVFDDLVILFLSCDAILLLC
jgi:hypothetical protein